MKIRWSKPCQSENFTVFTLVGIGMEIGGDDLSSQRKIVQKIKLYYAEKYVYL